MEPADQLKLNTLQIMEDHQEMIKRLIEKAIMSGAINVSEYDKSDMGTPKMILCAVYQEMVSRTTPPSAKGKKIVKNIYTTM